MNHHLCVRSLLSSSLRQLSARLPLVRIALVVVVILSSVFALGQPVATVRAGIGENGAAFTGYRPNPTPGEFDLHSEFAVPYSAELNTLNSISIEAWVYRDKISRNETIVGNGRNSSYWLGLSALGWLQFTPGGTAHMVSTQSPIAKEVWTHVAVTLNTA